MKEGVKFIGRHYEEDEKEDLKEDLKRWSEESLQPIEEELEKSEEEVRMIEAINEMIRAELKLLGHVDYQPILPENIHILPGEIFQGRFPKNSGFRGFFRSTSDVVFVNRDKIDTKARMFSLLLHELIHRASEGKFYADRETGGVQDARVGYRISSPWKKPGREDRLRGFNEAMVDFTTYKILLRNQEILERDFEVTEKDIQGPIYSYMHYTPIMESLIAKISEDKGVRRDQVFEDFERGQFESNILVLKDVERSFGKGSLEVLSFLGSLENEDDDEKLEVMIRNFFTEQDESKRQDIRAEILAFVEKARQSEK